jgi:large subunit ribosomal protein L25
MHSITLYGKPADIPECIEPDISQLEVGQSILLEELVLPEGIIAIGKPKAQVLGVTTSRMMAKAEEEDAAAAAEGEGEATTEEGTKEADAGAGEKK